MRGLTGREQVRRRLISIHGAAAISVCVAGALGGCGGGEISLTTRPSSSRPAASDKTPSVSHATPSTTVSSGNGGTPASVGFSGTANDQQGDEVSLSVSAGAPVTMSSVSDPVVHACDGDVESQQSTPERSIAIPLTVTMTVESSLATAVSVDLDGFGLISQGNVDDKGESELDSFPLWAGGYSSGATCAVWNDLGAGVVQWTSDVARPNSPQEWSAWLVIPNVISPNDPTGTDVSDRVVIEPGITLGEATEIVPNVESSQSPDTVECYSDIPLIPQDAPFLAVDPSTALANGCKPLAPPKPKTPTVTDAESSDAICNEEYPAHDQVETTTDVRGGTETMYNRVASLDHICTGFGQPQGLDLSPGMSCAIIAAAATVTGGGQFDTLCDTESVIEGYRSGGWLGAGSGLVKDAACNFVGDVFARAGGIAVAGATADSGPAAVVLGVGAYKALSASAKLVCGSILDGGAKELGEKLESDHETAVAADVISKQKCLLLSQKKFPSGTSWHAAPCSSSNG